ncbi:MAG TPA: tripartite tricarboxylate transporter substrate binding protein [Ramlibacter sp.]
MKMTAYFRRLLLRAFLLVLACAGLHAAAQEKFPSNPVEFIVPWGPGGGSDQTARVLAELLASELKVPVPVLNVPGATGAIGIQKMIAAPADGYKIGLLAWDSLATLASQSPGWKAEDLAPLGIVIQLPSALYVSGDKFPNWKAVEDAARKQPLTVGISGAGSPDEITINYFATKGIKFTQVPYPRPGERYAALIGGHIDLLYSPTGNVAGFVESKKMRPVLMLTAERAPDFPDTPTSKELGYDITLPQRRAVVVKAGTDPQRIQLLSDAIARAVASDKYKKFLKDSFASPASYVSQADSVTLMRSDLADMRKIIQSTKAQ